MAALAALTCAVGFVGLPFGASQAGESDDFLALINSARAAQGRSALQLDATLSNSACAWNANLVPTGDLIHDPNLSAVGSQIPGWTKLGENLGIGPSVSEIFTALMNSAAHRKNILDAAYNRVGICVDHDANSMLVTTHRFAAVGSPAPAPAPATSGAAKSTGTPAAAAAPTPTPAAATTPTAPAATAAIAPPDTAAPAATDPPPPPAPAAATTTVAPSAVGPTTAPTNVPAAPNDAALLAIPTGALVTASAQSSGHPPSVPFAATPSARSHRAKVLRTPIRRVFWVRVLKNLF